MFPQFKKRNKFEIIIIAVIIAIILGLGTSFFFMVVEKDSYSAIYIVPGSIFHSSDDNTVLYTYGVKSSESGKMDYTLYTYVNEKLLKTKYFSLNTGESLDERDKIILPPETQFPSKISLKLTTNTATEEIHFWLNEKG
jgi:flagellar basal body-associated protein FliL